jgi:hypothetical protein
LVSPDENEIQDAQTVEQAEAVIRNLEASRGAFVARAGEVATVGASAINILLSSAVHIQRRTLAT